VGGEGIEVATQILDKRPGHMQALRARTLAAGPLTALLRGEMRLAEALAMAEQSLRGWQEFVRLDPGNTVSWGNQLVGYQLKNEVLQQMGRPADAAAALRTGFDIDRLSPPSYRVRTVLMFSAGLLARLEASRGNLRQAEEALALQSRWKPYLLANAASGFDTALWTFSDAYWRLLATHAAGDYRRVVETAPPLIAGLDKVATQDDGERSWKDLSLRQLNLALAQAAYLLKDYSTAERAMSRVLEIRTHQPWLEQGDRREVGYERAFAALVLARQGRQAEAQKLIAPVLEFERGLSPKNRDDPTQRLELAVALYVASVAGLGDASAQLAEANALIDKLPAEMRGLRDVAAWHQGIVDERSRRRAG
jgi:tetratricopeptide (TPR) repeat protein